VAQKLQRLTKMLVGEKLLVRAVCLQWAAVVLITLICSWFGSSASVSGLAGGVSYALPTTLFALTLMLKARIAGAKGANPVSLLMGELLKIGGCLAILGLCIAYLSPLVWPAFIGGLILTVQSQFLVLVFK
jgi:F0F1-type ATP synthase assembly protein I